MRPGTSFGACEIVAPLGAGGMGVVYRARDTKLHRDVAIKVLPDAFAQDPDRLARFQREATTLASLNHPNIAIVHGLEQSDGVHALVMELVDGEGLDEKIGSGPRGRGIPLDEALAIAKQIAEALEAAHEQGIVHRDLKPANIKVKADGTVKVLDFGLARIVDRGGAGGAGGAGGSGREVLANSPTIATPAMTQAGIILGTAAYMSPEQAKGKPVDRRADIWAFGVVLYEMLAGRRAFDGEDVSDLLVAVLSQDVDMGALPSGTPPEVLRLIRRCLVRDPRQRLRDIGEARILLGGSDPQPPESVAVSATPAAAKTMRGWWRPIAAAAAAVLLTSAIWSAMRPASSVPVRILDVPGTAGVRFLALSPDGSTVAYATGDGLHLRRLDAPSATRIVQRDDVRAMTFSPDGESIAYYTNQDLRVVRRDGSEGRTVWRDIWRNDVQLAWVGDALYVPAADGIRRVPIAGGESTLVAPDAAIPKARTPLRFPVVLENGRTILVNPGLGGEGRFDFGTLWAFRDGQATQVLSLPQTSINGLSFDAASGTLLISASDQERSAIWLVPFEAATLAAGPAQPLLTGGGASAPSLDGTVAFITGEAYERGSAPEALEWRGRDGTLIRSVQQRQHDLRELSLSPDGRRLAVRAITEIGAAGGLWVYDLQTGVQSLVSAEIDNFAMASWSPDGRQLAFVAGNGSLRLVTVGAGQPPSELIRGATRAFPAWTRDGKRVVFSRRGAGEASEIVEIAQDGSAAPTVLGTVDGPVGSLALSPDGRWLAYESKLAVSVADFPALSTRETVSVEEAVLPQWSPDGSEVWFVQRQRDLVSVTLRVQGGRPTPAAPRVLWSAPEGVLLWRPIGGRGFGTVDGQQFLVHELRVVGERRITVVQNLRALVAGRSTGGDRR